MDDTKQDDSIQQVGEAGAPEPDGERGAVPQAAQTSAEVIAAAIDDEDDESILPAEISQQELIEEMFYNPASQKKQLRKFPAMFASAVKLAWASGPRPFLFCSAMQLVMATGAGALLLVGRNALTQLLTVEGLSGGYRKLLPQLVAFGLITVAMKVARVLQTKEQQMLSEVVARQAMQRVLDVSATIDLVSFENSEFYDRLRRASMSASNRPWEFVWGVLGTIGAILSIGGIAVALLAIQPIMLPLVIVAYLPQLIARNKMSRESHAQWKEMMQPSRVKHYLDSVLTGRDEAKEVRAFNLGGYIRTRWEAVSDDILAKRRSLLNKQLRLQFIGEIQSVALYGVVIGIFIWMLLSHRMTIAAAAAAAVALQMMSRQLSSMLYSFNSLYDTALFLEDYDSFVAMKPQIDQSRPTAKAPAGFEHLAVRGLDFAYPGATTNALKGIDLDIHHGEVIALVGENGSGKTTLAKLLAGLYAPTSGAITWNGVDTATYDPDSLRDSISVIFQDFVRYKLAARENIGAGRHERSENFEAIQAAARGANAEKIMRKLPEGYETILSKEFKGGRDLSVGQWQRIAMARAFFRDAPFIILDEPTAALDARAEQQLFDNIRTLCRGRSVLLISHRFSSVRTADRTYVLQDGEVIEHGTHAELMAQKGLYAELFTLQASAYVDG